MKRRKTIASSGSKNARDRTLSDPRRAELKASFAPTLPQPRLELIQRPGQQRPVLPPAVVVIYVPGIKKWTSSVIKTIFEMHQRMNSQSR
jgi:hypothetical protein